MRTIVLSSSLIAFSIACGYAKPFLFPYLFFVELFTVALFLSGMLAGPAWGLWIGGVARLVFSIANPYGPAHPWILVAQVVGAALVGALGGLAGPWLFRGSDRGSSRARILLLVACGFVATLLYDALTTVAQSIVFASAPMALALAVLPALQHLASNLVIFAVVGDLAIPWLAVHPMAVRRAA